MAGLNDSIRFAADLGTRVGNGLLFGQGDTLGGLGRYGVKNAAALVGLGEGTTLEKAMQEQTAAMDRAKQNTGAVGEIAELTGSVLGPGALLMKGAGAIATGAGNVAKMVPGVGRIADKLPSLANIMKTGESVAKAVPAAARTAEVAAAPVASASRALVPAVSNFGPAIPAAAKAAPTLLQQGKALLPEALKAGGQLVAGMEAMDPNSGIRTAMSDFFPNIANQAAENGALGMLGATVGGGLKLAKEVAFAPVPSAQGLGAFMRGATGQPGLEAQKAAVQPAAAEANPNAPPLKNKPLTQEEQVLNLMVGRTPDKVAKMLGLFPAKPKGKDAMQDMLSQLLERQLQSRLKAAADDPVAQAQIMLDMQQQYSGALANQPFMVAPSEE